MLQKNNKILFVLNQFDCCGLYNYTDTEAAQEHRAQFSDGTDGCPKCVVPYSCCADQTGANATLTCQKKPADVGEDDLGPLKQGCWEEFENLIDDNQSYILGAGLATVLLIVCFNICSH